MYCMNLAEEGKAKFSVENLHTQKLHIYQLSSKIRSEHTCTGEGAKMPKIDNMLMMVKILE